MKKTYFLWSIIITFSIVPIVIDIYTRESSQGLTSFVWSLYLIPSILIMIMYPKRRVIIGTIVFYIVLKYAAYFSNDDATNNLITLTLILETFVDLAILTTVSYLRTEHKKLIDEMQRLIIVDPLTNLYNRRYFDLYMEEVIPLYKRMNNSLSLIMIDIDHFKKINDTYGHLCGDEALKHISSIIKETVRDSDACIRYGGEEFVIILPRTLSADALVLANRLRKKVEQTTFIHHGEVIPFTVSLGIAEYAGESLQSFVEKADKALYSAKETGRNRVVLHNSSLLD